LRCFIGDASNSNITRLPIFVPMAKEIGKKERGKGKISLVKNSIARKRHSSVYGQCLKNIFCPFDSQNKLERFEWELFLALPIQTGKTKEL